MEPNHSSPEVTTVAGSGAAGTPATCRWNPTKEQISMLENLYRQGVRTPTAEQIQEITNRLQAYGHIEGKNVFYWFQNHKARQRQKQKQDHLSFLHQYLHHHHHQQPVFSLAPPPNVLHGPCYPSASDFGFYAQYPKVLLPSTNSMIKRRSPRAAKLKSPNATGFNAAGNDMIFRQQDQIVNGNSYCHQETLDLFPLHPTGILQERGEASTSYGSPASTACTSSSSDSSGDQFCFDFFSGASHS